MVCDWKAYFPSGVSRLSLQDPTPEAQKINQQIRMQHQKRNPDTAKTIEQMKRWDIWMYRASCSFMV